MRRAVEGRCGGWWWSTWGGWLGETKAELVKALTAEEQELLRAARMGEKCEELPCPFCRRPRVKRSAYIRCNRCGLNWLDGQDLMLHPHSKGQPMRGTGFLTPGGGLTAPTAGSMLEE
jgi:ribosomal protein L37AE/L43A